MLIVILIFLMVTTTYSRYSELQINLPTADANKPEERPNQINVAVDGQGKYVINKAPVPFRSPDSFADRAAARGRQHRGSGDRHQRRRRRHAPVGDQRHGSSAHRRLQPHHLHDASVKP